MDATLHELVDRAREGDQVAWDEIVTRFSGLVWATARAHRLSGPQAADVAQYAWLRLVENLDRIEDPQRLGAWLATTTRRECLRMIAAARRESPTDEEWMWDVPSDEAPDAELLARERDRALWAALRSIDERCQALLRMVSSPDPPSYEEIGAALDMPIGAIGPTRARCLDKLRRTLELEGADLR
jgi:RNA polymerase sigma factor (sigma-70 family)